jgi:hypothetical protein
MNRVTHERVPAKGCVTGDPGVEDRTAIETAMSTQAGWAGKTHGMPRPEVDATIGERIVCTDIAIVQRTQTLKRTRWADRFFQVRQKWTKSTLIHLNAENNKN